MNLTTSQMFDLLERDYASQVDLPEGTSALEALKASRAARQKRKELIGELCAEVPQILQFMDEIEAASDQGLLDDPSDIAEFTWGQVSNRLKAGIGECLADENSAVRRAVCLPMLKHRLNCPKATKGEAEAVLGWAQEKKFLVRSEGGKLGFSTGFGLTDEDKAELAPMLKALVAKIPKSIKPAAAPVSQKPPAPDLDSEPPVADGEITPGQAWRREFRGRFRLEIPANGNGKGGFLILEVQDHQILHVVEGGNGFGDLNSQSMLFSFIRDEEGNLKDHLNLIPPQHTRDPERWMIRAERLASVIQRGFRAALEGQKDMDPAEFLVDGGPIGDSVITVEDFRWEPHYDPDASFEFDKLSLQFRRRDDGQIALTEILTKSPEAEEVFGGSLGVFRNPWPRESRDAKEAFMGMDSLAVSVFLRFAYGQFVKPKKR